MSDMKRRIPCYGLLSIVLIGHLIMAPVKADPGDIEIYQDGKILLGVGAAIVRLDSKFTVIDKQTGDRLFLDPEGHLGLPARSHVTNFYGGYQFNKKHAFGIAYFKINRSTELFDFEGNLDDIILVKADATLSDKTSFTRIFYGYSLFRDDRSAVRILGGLFVLDLKLVLEAEGQITVGGVTNTQVFREEVSQVAPLPMFGLDFNYYFTPKWSIDTAVLFVGGSYQDVSAAVLQSSIRATYHATKHIGLDMGISYFDADVTIENETERQEIIYGYDGVFIGIHAKF
jgi:hypothetical protein